MKIHVEIGKTWIFSIFLSRFCSFKLNIGSFSFKKPEGSKVGESNGTERHLSWEKFPWPSRNTWKPSRFHSSQFSPINFLHLEINELACYNEPMNFPHWNKYHRGKKAGKCGKLITSKFSMSLTNPICSEIIQSVVIVFQLSLNSWFPWSHWLHFQVMAPLRLEWVPGTEARVQRDQEKPDEDVEKN